MTSRLPGRQQRSSHRGTCVKPEATLAPRSGGRRWARSRRARPGPAEPDAHCPRGRGAAGPAPVASGGPGRLPRLPLREVPSPDRSVALSLSLPQIDENCSTLIENIYFYKRERQVKSGSGAETQMAKGPAALAAAARRCHLQGTAGTGRGAGDRAGRGGQGQGLAEAGGQGSAPAGRQGGWGGWRRWERAWAVMEQPKAAVEEAAALTKCPTAIMGFEVSVRLSRDSCGCLCSRT